MVASGGTFAGGIVNSTGGVISAKLSAITVSDEVSFAGGIVNKGMIVGGGIGAINVALVSDFSGGITNSGTIRGLNGGGILIAENANFSGDVVNASGGVISAAQGFGIELSQEAISGFLSNGGKITARTGIALLNGTTITGAIVDSGTIVATSHGILVDAASEILSTQTAVDIVGRTFTGGIFNAGVISGRIGIEIVSASSVSIFDAGAIIGSAGTAIEFAGSGNTLTLGAGYVIGGIVDPSGNNTFQLGGTGSDTFDLSSIGTQYLGFTTLQRGRRHLDRQRHRRRLECPQRPDGTHQRHAAQRRAGERRRKLWWSIPAPPPAPLWSSPAAPMSSCPAARPSASPSPAAARSSCCPAGWTCSP